MNVFVTTGPTEDLIDNPREKRMRQQTGENTQKEPGAAGEGRPWKVEIEAILAAAPEVTPDIDELARMAEEELARETAEPGPEVPPPKPTKPESAAKEAQRDETFLGPIPSLQEPDELEEESQPVTSREPESAAVTQKKPPPAEKPAAVAPQPTSPDPYGYAFEASCLSEMVRGIVGQTEDVKGDLSARLGRATEFLASFSRWAVESRRAPVEGYLEQAAKFSENLAQSLGDNIAIAVSGEDVRVLPGVGDLVCFLIKEIFSASLPLRRRGRKDTAEVLPVTIAAGSGRGFFTYRISGLPSLARVTQGQPQFEFQQRMAEIGGRIDRGSHKAEILLTLPDNFHSVEILTAHTGSGHVGIPWHRVLELREQRMPEKSEHDPDAKVEWKGQAIDLFDLREPHEGGQGKEGGALVAILGTAAGAFAIALGGIVRYRREALVQPIAQIDAQGTISGHCIFADEGQRIPLLAPWPLSGGAERESET